MWYNLLLLFIRNASVYFPTAGIPTREIAGTISSLISATLPHSSHSSTFGHHGKLAAYFLWSLHFPMDHCYWQSSFGETL